MTLPAGGARRRGSGRPEEIRANLSERDLRILSDLARVRLLTGRLIQQLHFKDGSPLTSARKSRSTLQRLSEIGVVTRLERRIGGVRAGSSGYLYGLSARGQRVMDVDGPAGGTRRRKPWEPSRWFVEHILAVSQLYVELRSAERRGRVELLSFDAEPAAWRTWKGLGGDAKVLKPDAYVELATHSREGEYEHLSFVEVDRSTESLSVIKRKALVYVDYWRSGAEQRRAGSDATFPEVVWLADTAKRAEQITDVLARLDPDTWQLFRVGTINHGAGLLTGEENEQPTKGEEEHGEDQYKQRGPAA